MPSAWGTLSTCTNNHRTVIAALYGVLGAGAQHAFPYSVLTTALWMEPRPSWRTRGHTALVSSPSPFPNPPGEEGHLEGRLRKPRLPCLCGGLRSGSQWPVGCFLEGRLALRSPDGKPLSAQVTPSLRRGLQGSFSGLCGIAGSSGFEGRPVSPDRLHLVCSEGIYGFIKLLNWLFFPLQNISSSLQGQF